MRPLLEQASKCMYAHMLCGALFVGVALAQLAPVPAQDGATIQGMVRDASGQPVAGASVTLERTGSSDERDTLSDASGNFRFRSLAPGSYTLTARKDGEGTATGTVTTGADGVRTIPFVLQASAASASPEAPAFFDEPKFTVAGVTDPAAAGGHGPQAVVRSTEALARDTVSLSKPAPSNSPPESEKSLRESIEHDPANADPHHALAELQEKSGRPVEAVQEYQKAAELRPSERNIFDWGAELLLHNALQPAIQIFTRGAKLFPQSTRMLVGLGVAHEAAGSYDAAAQALFQASDLNPTDPTPYLFLGRMQAVVALPTQGVRERMQRFADLHSESALANYYYAVSLWDRRQPSSDTSTQAQALLQKALRLDPSLAAAHLQLCALYSDRGDSGQAIAACEDAAKTDASLEEAHYRLAQLYRRSGDAAKAQAELEQYRIIDKKKSEEANRQHREIQQFVFTMKPQANP